MLFSLLRSTQEQTMDVAVEFTLVEHCLELSVSNGCFARWHREVHGALRTPRVGTDSCREGNGATAKDPTVC